MKKAKLFCLLTFLLASQSYSNNSSITYPIVKCIKDSYGKIVCSIERPKWGLHIRSDAEYRMVTGMLVLLGCATCISAAIEIYIRLQKAKSNEARETATNFIETTEK